MSAETFLRRVESSQSDSPDESSRCRKCKNVLPSCEKAAYGGFLCENCWVPKYSSGKALLGERSLGSGSYRKTASGRETLSR